MCACVRACIRECVRVHHCVCGNIFLLMIKHEYFRSTELHLSPPRSPYNSLSLSLRLLNKNKKTPIIARVHVSGMSGCFVRWHNTSVRCIRHSWRFLLYGKIAFTTAAEENETNKTAPNYTHVKKNGIKNQRKQKLECFILVEPLHHSNVMQSSFKIRIQLL